MIGEKVSIDLITHKIIEAAIEVHQTLGPGLLESIYEGCLAIELEKKSLKFERQKPIPIIYKGCLIGDPYRLDLIVENSVILELKTVEKILPIHSAQILTYLKLTGCKVGLIINFNSARLVDGIKRVVNSFGSDNTI